MDPTRLSGVQSEKYRQCLLTHSSPVPSHPRRGRSLAPLPRTPPVLHARRQRPGETPSGLAPAGPPGWLNGLWLTGAPLAAIWVTPWPPMAGRQCPRLKPSCLAPLLAVPLPSPLTSDRSLNLSLTQFAHFLPGWRPADAAERLPGAPQAAGPLQALSASRQRDKGRPGEPRSQDAGLGPETTTPSAGDRAGPGQVCLPLRLGLGADQPQPGPPGASSTCSQLPGCPCPQRKPLWGSQGPLEEADCPGAASHAGPARASHASI